MIKTTKKTNMKARVICIGGMTNSKIKVGDIVTLTRDDRDEDGTVATDMPGTWGRIGHAYELIEDEMSEWNGKGRAPVGWRGEANNGGNSEYFKCEVVAHHFFSGREILKTEHSSLHMLTEKPDCWKLRPIRTAEEVAVEAIGGIVAYEAGWKSRPCNETANAIYAAIRDGKIPGVKLEEGK